MTSFIAWCWVGLIAGVSFIATPAKFFATSSSLGQLLEVGQVTFSTFKTVEIVLLIFLSISIAIVNIDIFTRKGMLLSLVLILFFQYAFLMPRLDDRIERIVRGLATEPTCLHSLYILAELSKLIILILLGAAAQKHTLKAGANANN